MPEENNSIVENVNIENQEQGETTPSYDFLDPEKSSVNNADIITSQFDNAFKNASPVIQNYILGDKLEENIKLICKIEKLDEDKAKVIIENITVSILVGLLPIDVAKETMIESFRSSGILLEPFAAGMIMKNIDAYILSDIRKQVLESKLEEKKEIRHLTLREKKEEAEKEELRKILLERTGNLTGKGQPIIQYKERDIPKPKEEPKAEIGVEKKTEVNRESLLAKINLKNVSDVDKVRDRMQQIKKEEADRLARLQNKEKKEEERIKAIKERDFEESEIKVEEEEVKETVDLSKEFANALKEKLLSHANENTDLNLLREERSREEVELEKTRDTAYSRALSEEIGDSENILDATFDPYRETI